MTGTLINVATILIGGTLGLIFGARVPNDSKPPSFPAWDFSLP